MKILQIGYGEMGKFICRALKNNKMISKLVVSDSKIQQPYEKDGVRFVGDIKGFDISEFDCAFVCTPATTHYQIAEMLLDAGCKNIYMEKPAVMNMEEYNKISKMKDDCKIVSGYILRQSEPIFAMKCIINKMLAEGFRMELCSVTYQKNLPNSMNERAQGDIGVFEEIVHIWDLLFNYLEFKLGECEMLDRLLENDPDRADRIIYAQLSYYLRFPDFNALLRLTSSFKAEEKKREFFFTYKDGNGNRRHIFLSFDNKTGSDWLIVTEANGHILYKEEYRSMAKLDHEMAEVLNYFKTGEQYNLSLFEDSLTVIELLNEAGLHL